MLSANSNLMSSRKFSLNNNVFNFGDKFDGIQQGTQKENKLCYMLPYDRKSLHITYPILVGKFQPRTFIFLEAQLPLCHHHCDVFFLHMTAFINVFTVMFSAMIHKTFWKLLQPLDKILVALAPVRHLVSVTPFKTNESIANVCHLCPQQPPNSELKWRKSCTLLAQAGRMWQLQCSYLLHTLQSE